MAEGAWPHLRGSEDPVAKTPPEKHGELAPALPHSQLCSIIDGIASEHILGAG